MVFSRSILKQVVSDAGPEGYAKEVDEFVSVAPWGSTRSMVFSHGERFYSVRYEVSESGNPEERPFAGGPEMVECTEVWPAVVPLATFLPHKQKSHELRIVVTGNGPDACFVEVENADGKSVPPSETRTRPDGLREIVFTEVPA